MTTDSDLTLPLSPGTRIVVAGVAGGVGTTTVAAIIWATLTRHRARPVGALDHSTGRLFFRLPHGAEDTCAQARLSPEISVHDLGPHALTDQASALDNLHSTVLIVCGAHHRGLENAAEAMAHMTSRTGSPGTQHRCLVVPVAVNGKTTRGPLTQAANDLGLTANFIHLPHIRLLAPGGPIPAPHTLSALHPTADLLTGGVVRRAHWLSQIAGQRPRANTFAAPPHAGTFSPAAPSP